jgi:hypothetical protein
MLRSESNLFARPSRRQWFHECPDGIENCLELFVVTQFECIHAPSEVGAFRVDTPQTESGCYLRSQFATSGIRAMRPYSEAARG